MGHDRETLETVLVHAAEGEVRELSRYLRTLATIGNIASPARPSGYGDRHDQGLHGDSGNGGQGERRVFGGGNLGGHADKRRWAFPSPCPSWWLTAI